MPRSGEGEDVRIAKPVAVLCEEIACFEDLDAENDEGDFSRFRCEGVAPLGG